MTSSRRAGVIGGNPPVPVRRECRVVERSRIRIVIQDSSSSVVEFRYCVVMGAADGVVCVASGGRERYRLVRSAVDPITQAILLAKRTYPKSRFVFLDYLVLEGLPACMLRVPYVLRLTVDETDHVVLPDIISAH